MGIRITDEHEYFNDSGVQYQGVTSLVSLYKQPFDQLAVAIRYAAKNGGTPEYWIGQWEAKKNNACDRGHTFHAHKEDLSMGRGVDTIRGAVKMVRNQNLYYHRESLYSLPDGMYPELMLWDDGYKLAGTADKVNIETSGGYRYVDIDDYKTNEQIESVSYQFTNGDFKMMQYPVAHMMDCNLSHYELQLSFYMFVLERHGFTPRTLTITHYPPPITGNEKKHTDVIKRKEVVPYILEYRKREVIAILNHFNKQRHERATN